MLTKNLLLKKKINYNLAILSTKKLTMAILLNLKTKLQCFNPCTECLVIKAFYETILAPLLKMYIL